jgi:hypothetical protein
MVDVQGGLVSFDEAGIPCAGGFRLPALSANAIMRGAAREEAERANAEAERTEAAGVARDMAFSRLIATGQGPESAPTLGDIFGRELARSAREWRLHEMGLAIGPGGRYVDAWSGEPLPEIDVEGPRTAARSLTAEPPALPPPDPVETARSLHQDLIGYMARADYQGALARARAQGGSDYVG